MGVTPGWESGIYGYGYGYLSVFVWAPNMDGMFAADRIEESSGRMLTGCRFDGDDSIYSIRVCLLCKLGRVAYGNKETKLSICVSMKWKYVFSCSFLDSIHDPFQLSDICIPTSTEGISFSRDKECQQLPSYLGNV